MKIKIDPIGKKYGKLLVLEEFSSPIVSTQKYRKSLLKLKCQCDCGQIVTAHKGNVLYGKTTQCRNCQNSHVKIGEKIGALTIISRNLYSPSPKYLCKCDCGFEDLYGSRFLSNGKHLLCKKCRFPKKYGPQVLKKTKKQALADTNFKKHLRSKSALIGQKIGRLKIIAFSHWVQEKTRRRAHYKAKCKCGNEIIIRGCFCIKSCGCLQRESVQKGENQSVAKLTNSQAEAIREFKKSNIGYTGKQLADMFKVTECIISRILLGKSYKKGEKR